MYNYTHSFIDAIQDAKIKAVTAVVPHEALSQPLCEFIESQRQYTKSVVDTFSKLYTAATSSLTTAPAKGSRK